MTLANWLKKMYSSVASVLLLCQFQLIGFAQVPPSGQGASNQPEESTVEGLDESEQSAEPTPAVTAQNMFMSGKNEEVIDFVDASIRAGQRDPKLLQVKANALRNLGRLDEAKQLFDKLVRALPGDANSYVGRALLHQANGDIKSAIADAEKCIELGEFSGYLLRARLFESVGNITDAIHDHTKIIELSASDKKGLLNSLLTRGNLYLQLMQFDLAANDANRSRRLEETAAAHRILMTAYGQIGQIEGVRSELQLANALSEDNFPNDVAYCRILLNNAAVTKDLELPREEAKKLLGSVGDDPEGIRGATIKRLFERIEEKEKLLKRESAAAIKHSRPRNRLSQEQVQELASRLEEAKGEERLDLLLQLAHIGMYVNSEENVKRYLPLIDKEFDVDSLTNRQKANMLAIGSWLASQDGDKEKARELARRAVTVDPKFATAHRIIATQQLADGNEDLALASAKKAVQLDPLSDINHGVEGLVYMTRDDYQKAIDSFSQGLSLNPRNNWIRTMRGLIGEEQKFPNLALTDIGVRMRNAPVDVLLHRASLWYDYNLPQLAYQDALRLTELNPTQNSLTWAMAAESLFAWNEQNKREGGIEVSNQLMLDTVEKAIAAKPDRYSLQYMRAVLYKRAGQIQDAIDGFKAVIDSGTALYATYFQLAACYDEVGDYGLAVENLLIGQQSIPEGTAQLLEISNDDLERIRQKQELQSKLAELNLKDNPTKLYDEFLPTLQELEQVVQPWLAKKLSKIYKQQADTKAKITVGDAQTRIVVSVATTEDLRNRTEAADRFPGGYDKVAQQLQPDVKWFRVQFLEPNKKRGTSLSSFVKIDGRWLMIASPWLGIDQ